MRRLAAATTLALTLAIGMAGGSTATDPEPAFAAQLTACLVVREAVRRGYDPVIALPTTLKVCTTPVRGVPR